jgi:hypothetical protein
MDLETFNNGDTDYIEKHNRNVNKIEADTNKNSQDIEALKTNLNAGNDADYRTNNVNVLRNGALLFWNGSVPVGWELSSGTSTQGIGDSYINKYSLHLQGEIFQTSINHYNLKEKHITFGAWVKTEEADDAQLLINQNGVLHESTPQFHTGSGEWEYLQVQLYFTNYLTTPLRFVLKSTVSAIFSGMFLVYGNPIAGGKNVFQDYGFENVSSKLTYETGIFSVMGKGVHQEVGVYQYLIHVSFQVEKLRVPNVIVDVSDTGETYFQNVIYVDTNGFDLLVSSLSTEDFILSEVYWEAEVPETTLL